jgi:hypothetical protein
VRIARAARRAADALTARARPRCSARCGCAPP